VPLIRVGKLEDHKEPNLVLSFAKDFKPWLLDGILVILVYIFWKALKWKALYITIKILWPISIISSFGMLHREKSGIPVSNPGTFEEKNASSVVPLCL
jgi:hypothetical protein